MKIPLTALALILAAPNAAIAAEDGQLATGESKGSYGIELTVETQKTIQISGLEDLVFDFPGDQLGQEREAMRLCVIMPEGGNFDLELEGPPLTNNIQAPYDYQLWVETNTTLTDREILRISDKTKFLDFKNIPANTDNVCDRSVTLTAVIEDKTDLVPTTSPATAKVKVTVFPR